MWVKSNARSYTLMSQVADHLQSNAGWDQQVCKGAGSAGLHGLGSAGKQGVGISRCAGGWNQQAGETLELRHAIEHDAGLLKAALRSHTSTNASFMPYSCQQLGVSWLHHAVPHACRSILHACQLLE